MKRCILLIAVLFVSGCSLLNRTCRVSDIKKPETITLYKQANEGSIYGIEIVGKGSVDGDATISLMLNGAPYKTERLSGKIKFKWGGDWYSDSAEIRYDPIQVNGGNLMLKYNFYAL